LFAREAYETYIHAFYPENDYYATKTTINATLSCFCDYRYYNVSGYSELFTKYTSDGLNSYDNSTVAVH